MASFVQAKNVMPLMQHSLEQPLVKKMAKQRMEQLAQQSALGGQKIEFQRVDWIFLAA